MKICWMSLSMKRSRSCQRVTHQEMRWEKPQMPAKPSTDKILWSEESLQVHTKWMLFISSETSIFRTRSHWTRLTSCVLFDHHFEEYQSCIWSFKMVDNSLDLYSRSCMMRSKTTTTSNNGMTNGPRWGIHMSEAHLIAIADTPVPANRERANTGSWQIKGGTESGTKVGQRSESESIINSTMENRWSCSSAKTSSSTSATEGWKRPRERWKILFTPWWRLESSRILWMGIQTISRFDLCIGPDWTWQCGTAIIAHDLPLLHCKWFLRGIWAG